MVTEDNLVGGVDNGGYTVIISYKLLPVNINPEIMIIEVVNTMYNPISILDVKLGIINM